MKRIKKVLMILLLMLSFGLLACGGNEKPVDPTIPTPTPVIPEDIKVMDIVVKGIKDNQEIEANDEIELEILVTPSNATNKDVKVEVVTGTNVISVKNNRTIKALNMGEATLVVTTLDGSNIKKEFNIKVVEKKLNPKMIVILANSPDGYGVKVGKDLSLYVEVYPSEASQEVEWSSSDPTIATIDENGIVHGVKEGDVTITATSKIDKNVIGETEVFIFSLTIDDIMAEKLKEEGTVEEDIIAGIDHNSIKIDGELVYFNSKLGNDEVVRFEGSNILITDEGIVFKPDGYICSLDAVGRIYKYYIEKKEDNTIFEETDNIWFSVSTGYTYSKNKTSVNSSYDIHITNGLSMDLLKVNEPNFYVYEYEPNYIHIKADNNCTKDITLNKVFVTYNTTEKVTDILEIKLNMDFATSYLEGEKYNYKLEKTASTDEGTLEFYLFLKMNTGYSSFDNDNYIKFVPGRFVKFGDLKDKDGNVLDKTKANLYKGTTVDITIGDYSFVLELPVLERYSGATTLKDLTPDAVSSALGELNTLVVPLVWSDQKKLATDEMLKVIKKSLGRIIDENGNMVDYSDFNDEVFSLSEYFDISSYGKMNINSFLTSYYYTDKTFEEYSSRTIEKSYADEVLEWVKKTYKDLDWTKYDQDGNGYLDSVIIINIGEREDGAMFMQGYSYAIHYREVYSKEYAGTQDNPNINGFVSLNHTFLENGSTSTLIHEVSHNFGLIDYYDVTYSGIDAVGCFDMQSKNVGDWNAYSKLAVGWMDPTIVSDLKKGEYIDITIGSSALKNDVIIIPTAKTEYDGPFGEYIMIDLFSSDGVNKFDASLYGLDGAVGVRISHVNANMEYRKLEGESKINPGEKFTYEIGTIHNANNYKNSESGIYNIEVIQSGKKNTFTNKENEITALNANDLFYVGDVFTVEEYSEFFYEGLMDSGLEFGYSVTVTNISKDADGNPVATIRVTAK